MINFRHLCESTPIVCIVSLSYSWTCNSPSTVEDNWCIAKGTQFVGSLHQISALCFGTNYPKSSSFWGYFRLSLCENLLQKAPNCWHTLGVKLWAHSAILPHIRPIPPSLFERVAFCILIHYFPNFVTVFLKPSLCILFATSAFPALTYLFIQVPLIFQEKSSVSVLYPISPPRPHS